MENLIQKAIAAALKAHDGEVRKGDGRTPYVLHPLEVGIVVSYYTLHPQFIAAAILHDTIEHGKLTREEIAREFGAETADLVALLTENASIADWTDRKFEAAKRAATDRAAAVIKAADAIVNMRDLFLAVRAGGAAVWERFNAPKEAKIAYFKLIFEETKAGLPAPLVEQYVSALKDLEYVDLLPGDRGEIGFIAE